MSPILFIIVVDWVMKNSITGRTGVQWNVFDQLEDLEFADDVCLISENKGHMIEKTEKVTEEAAKLGLKINKKKSKTLTVNAEKEPMVIKEELEEVEKFCYLGSMFDANGGTDKDVLTRISKAQQAFYRLNNIWASNNITIRTKIRLFNTNIKSILLYGSETWNASRTNINRIQVFINKCLRKIMKIFWPNKISNKELWDRTNQEPIEITIRKRKWRWLGHTLRRNEEDVTRQSLEWNPVGKRSRGRPTQTWRRSLTEEMKNSKVSWGEIKKSARNREKWRHFVNALCSNGSQKD